MGECILTRRGGGNGTPKEIAIDLPFEYGDNTITLVEYDGTTGNWTAQLTQSGTLVFSQDTVADICLVGGGASGGSSWTAYGEYGGGVGGGGGGMTISASPFTFVAGTNYTVNIGAGGTGGKDTQNDGGDTSITGTGLTAGGGKSDGTGGTGTYEAGGEGGHGANAGFESTSGANGNYIFGDQSYGICLGAGGGGGGFRNDNTLDSNKHLGSAGGVDGGGKGGNAYGADPGPYNGHAGSDALPNTGSGGGGSGTGQTDIAGATQGAGHGSGAAGCVFIRNAR